jgi:hypothetical protein
MNLDKAYRLMAEAVVLGYLAEEGDVETLVKKMKENTNEWSWVCGILYNTNGGYKEFKKTNPELHEAIQTIKETLVFDTPSNKVVFEFDNPRMAYHFKSWLSGQGEQSYWMWMECREDEEEGNITAKDFDYHRGETVKARGREREEK